MQNKEPNELTIKEYVNSKPNTVENKKETVIITRRSTVLKLDKGTMTDFPYLKGKASKPDKVNVTAIMGMYRTNECLGNIYCDRDFLLEEDNINIQEQNSKIINCPEIIMKINMEEVFALLDTGSNIRCIQAKWLEKYKEH